MKNLPIPSTTSVVVIAKRNRASIKLRTAFIDQSLMSPHSIKTRHWSISDR